ncbi:MAG: hypothetical protein KC416_03490 [Myxococcales bacterium]|nr:hypothetical protein [Myxococcales bacterium]
MRTLATAETLQVAIDTARSAARPLQELPTEELLAILTEVLRDLGSRTSPGGMTLRRDLEQTTGLTSAMIEWALETTLAAHSPEALRTLARGFDHPHGGTRRPATLHALVLSANVFTACISPIIWSLLARVPTVAKASSRDDTLPHAFVASIRRHGPHIARALQVATFPGGQGALEDILLSQAEAVSIYGHDHTLRTLSARVPPTATVIAHGQGLGVGLIPAGTLRGPAEAPRLADQIALDVAAYDQRGCLSPHAILVQRGNGLDAEQLAPFVFDALARCAIKLPRGGLPREVAAAQLQWRGVAQARGTLLEGDGFAVSVEAGIPLRLSPGYRNIGLYNLAPGGDELRAHLTPFGTHLKALGVAGDDAVGQSIGDSLPPGLVPRISSLGSMQTPPVHGLVEGRMPWHGLLR